MLLSFAEGHDAILAELELATRHEGMTSDGVQSCMWRRDGKFQRVSWVVGRSMCQWHTECPLADVGSEGERYLDDRVKELEMSVLKNRYSLRSLNSESVPSHCQI